MASKRNVTWKCPFCDKRFDREKLVIHVDDKHENEIPEGFTALRYVFHYVNKRPLDYHGRCTECKGPTPWDEEIGRYKRQCGKKACHDSYVKRFEDNMVKKKGYTRETSTQEGLEKMLKNRKISGQYTFQNGEKRDYVGSYEKKCLEFMDKVMNIDPNDILSPGPVLEYKYEGKKHYYISDFYYQPYNLVIEVKDGGDNPNTRNMEEYRKKQIAKEEYIIKNTDFNYIRLTNNDFGQLMSVFADLKMQLVDNSKDRVIHVNESVKSINEKYLVNEDDILYNKDKFDSGEINLCFITGHSGSGKTTMSNNINDKNKDEFELDDLQWSWKFSDENLKEYGKLAYEFFTGPGKKYRIPYRIEKNGKLVGLTWEDVTEWFKKNGFVKDDLKKNTYYEESTVAFVNFAKKYAKNHKDIKFYVNGIQLFLWIKPETLKEYAVYIKGTSALISTIRSTKRDSMGNSFRDIIDNIDTFFRRIKDTIGVNGFESKLKIYRKYFSDLMKENNVNEDASNTSYNKIYYDISEGYIFSKGNLEINLDKWGIGTPLWICGSSGDGKSTLANKLAKENKALICHTDLLLIRISWPKEKWDSRINNPESGLYKMKNGDPGYKYILQHSDLPWNIGGGNYAKYEVLEPYFLDFFKWLIKECVSGFISNKMIIIEGCDIWHMNPDYMASQPLIILNNPRLKSLHQRAKRYSVDSNYIRALFKELKNYKSTVKPLDDQRDIFYDKVNDIIKEEAVFNEFMNALTSGYFPGYEDCDAYICTADYMQNNVFADCGQNFFAIASDPGLHNLIYVNNEGVLTSSSLEEFEKTYPNVIGHMNIFALKVPMSGIHNALANYIGEVLDREGMYYSVFKEHLYSIDQVRFSDKVLGEINNEINNFDTIYAMTKGTLIYNESDMIPMEDNKFYNYRDGKTYMRSEVNPDFFVETTSPKNKVFMEQILVGGMVNNG